MKGWNIMGNYQRINTLPPKGCESRKAYLVGGGIGSLSAAAFMIRDGHMKGSNITILEESKTFGGSMDGAGNAKDGYIVRGGREIEEHFECAWELYSFIPSLKNPERTVLDEFRELNLKEPNESHCRLVHKQGQKADFSNLGLSKGDAKKLIKLIMMTEDELGAKTIEEYFGKHYLTTKMWYYWCSMFAFETWHSVVEMKRYMERFIHLLPGMNQLKGILHSEYNQYDSMILPVVSWLTERGVRFANDARVTDLDIDIRGGSKTVTAIKLDRDGKADSIAVGSNDLVIVTNGSITENSTLGSMTAPPVLNRGPAGCFDLWKKIAAKDPAFGRPEVFCSDIDKTKWESFTMTWTDSEMPKLLKELTDRDPGQGGVVTISDSNWLMSWTCSKQPHFPNQPDNVLVTWAYGLFPDKEGDFIKKKMCECTGEELVQELLYHQGFKDRIPELMKKVKVIPCMMPYITSQFMPRVKGDRPEIVPAGSVNLAFIGQYAEIPHDCVFTVEYSIRGAMMAVYKLLALEKEVPEVHPSLYDVRVLAAATNTMYNGKVPFGGIIRRFLKGTNFEGLF
jgi:oleate hydratase